MKVTAGAAEKVTGFPPVFDEESRVLILGSFPSVQSRRVQFYYGNPQNRFWKMLCGYFQAPMPATTAEKEAFLHARHVALWDVAASCEIVGSADDSIRRYTVTPIEEVLRRAKIERILLNGKKAFQIFEENYEQCGVAYACMPSTSPANPRYDEKVWRDALHEIFGIG